MQILLTLNSAQLFELILRLERKHCNPNRPFRIGFMLSKVQEYYNLIKMREVLNGQ